MLIGMQKLNFLSSGKANAWDIIPSGEQIESMTWWKGFFQETWISKVVPIIS
jgi:hypothetical protein